MGISWAILEAAWAILEARQGPSETSCDHLGTMMRHLGHLGPSWMGFWDRDRPKNRWEMHQDWAGLGRIGLGGAPAAEAGDPMGLLFEWKNLNEFGQGC